MPSIFSRRRREDDGNGRPDEQTTSGGGVAGRNMDVAAPEVSSWDDRVTAMEAADPEGVRRGGMTLDHPDELMPFIDILPSQLPGYTWTVELHDEIQLFRRR